MQQMQPGARYTVRLRPTEYHKRCLAEGLNTDQARADAFRVSRSTVIRAQTGSHTPSADFIGSVLSALGVEFRSLFAIEALPVLQVGGSGE